MPQPHSTQCSQRGAACPQSCLVPSCCPLLMYGTLRICAVGWHCEPGDFRLGVRLCGHRLGQSDAVSKATLRVAPSFFYCSHQTGPGNQCKWRKENSSFALDCFTSFFFPPIPEHQSVFLFLLDFPYSLEVAELLFSFTDFFPPTAIVKVI